VFLFAAEMQNPFFQRACLSADAQMHRFPIDVLWFSFAFETQNPFLQRMHLLADVRIHRFSNSTL